MKIKHNQVINGYKALTDIGNQTLPAKTSYALYKIRLAMKPVWDFQLEQEKQMMDKYGSQDENGNMIIKDAEGKEKVQRMFEELIAMEEDINIEPIHIKLPDDIHITIDQFEALAPFVIFDE